MDAREQLAALLGRWLAQLKFRTVRDGDDAEGLCELYFKELQQAQDFIQAARKSEDLEYAGITDIITERVVWSWEK
jgi:hypothetical protein